MQVRWHLLDCIIPKQVSTFLTNTNDSHTVLSPALTYTTYPKSKAFASRSSSLSNEDKLASCPSGGLTFQFSHGQPLPPISLDSLPDIASQITYSDNFWRTSFARIHGQPHIEDAFYIASPGLKNSSGSSKQLVKACWEAFEKLSGSSGTERHRDHVL